MKLTKSGSPDINGTSVSVVSSTQITCSFNLAGAAAGQWNVVVTNPDTQFSTLTNGFTVIYPAPTVSGITPNSGVTGTTVNITNLAGTGFLSGATVKLTKSGSSDINWDFGFSCFVDADHVQFQPCGSRSGSMERGGDQH